MFDYSRCGNPTRLQLERLLASMEHAKYALATSSGMAATVTLMNLLNKDDHVLCVDDIHGGTMKYLQKVLGPNTQIEITFQDFSDVELFKRGLRPNTKYIWLETPTNPTLKVFDIAKLAKVVK